MADIIGKDDLNKKNPLGTAQPVRPGGQGAAPQGTGFTNIQRIIGANQGNKVGQAVAGGVQQAGQKVQQNIGQAKQQFNQNVDANRLDNAGNQQAASNIVDTASNLQGGQNLTADQMAQGQKFMAGDYQGPSDIQGSQNLVGQAVDAQQLGQAAGSSAGRQGLLQRFLGAPQYSQGQQKLDNLLLGANRGALAQSRDSVRGLAEQSANEIMAARGVAGEAASQNKLFAERFGKQAGDAYTGIDTALKTAYDTAVGANKTAADGYDTFESQLLGSFRPREGGGYTTGTGADPESIIESYAGLSPEAKQQLQTVVRDAKQIGVDPTTAVNNMLSGFKGAEGLGSVEQFAGQDQAARLQALAKLTGKDPRDFSGAGAYKVGSGQFDTEAADRASSSLGKITRDSAAAADTIQSHVRASGNPENVPTQALGQYLPPESAKHLQQIRDAINAGQSTKGLEILKNMYEKQITENARTLADRATTESNAARDANYQNFLRRGY